MMDVKELDKFRRKLEEMLVELNSSVEARAEETAPVELDSAIGRLSRMDAIQSQQMAIALKTRQQQQILRVQSALQSIAKGNYGLCKRCKSEMPLERLEAQPDAVLCLNCAGPEPQR